MTQPACQNHDPEIWFPSVADHTTKQRNAMIVTAQSICRDCPMRQACAKAALDTDATHGIWAGIWINRTGMSTTRRNALLADIAGRPAPDVTPTIGTIPSHCVNPDCGAPIVKQGAEIPEGHRRHGAKGLCNHCYMKERRDRANGRKDPLLAG